MLRSHGEGIDVGAAAVASPVLRALVRQHNYEDLFNGDKFELMYGHPPTTTTVGLVRLPVSNKVKDRINFSGVQ